MTSSRSTKRALLTSALAIVACVAMLVGSTFAWFTDTASTAVNQIRTGNLDIDVEYTLDGEKWAPLDEATDLFGDGLFEPGYTRVVAFRISNKGDLALKYNVSMNLVSETKGVNKAGKEFALSDYLKVKTSPIQEVNYIGNIMVGIAFDRNASKAIGWNPETNFKDTKVMTNDHILSAGHQVYFIMQVYMPESVGNGQRDSRYERRFAFNRNQLFFYRREFIVVDAERYVGAIERNIVVSVNDFMRFFDCRFKRRFKIFRKSGKNALLGFFYRRGERAESNGVNRYACN